MPRLKVKPTRMKIGLANRKTTQPYRVVEDVQVKVKKLIFSSRLCDSRNGKLLIYSYTPGRPFIATARAIIDMDKQEIAICSGREFEIFRFPSMRRGKMILRG
ncbi:hypothetical protein MTR_2g050100 [Medicago truncatula]|uniref:Uncharacterized protein n=1 Tax=Medicago truncatula TaxID=3880 RepID=A0A072VIG7_MEDTR|nr:hypothetical protein MTR_2g050100 [Medicago truncatula]